MLESPIVLNLIALFVYVLIIGMGVFNALKEEGEMDTAVISITVSPIPAFITSYYYNSSVLSAFVTCFAFYSVLFYFVDNSLDNKHEISTSVDMISMLHKLEEYLKSFIIGDIMVGIFIGSLSGLPIYLIQNKGLTYVLTYVLFVTIISVVVLSYVTVKRMDYYGIELEGDKIRMVKNSDLVELDLSEVKSVEEKRFRVILETENNKERIWCSNPSKLNRLVVSRII